MGRRTDKWLARFRMPRHLVERLCHQKGLRKLQDLGANLPTSGPNPSAQAPIAGSPSNLGVSRARDSLWHFCSKVYVQYPQFNEKCSPKTCRIRSKQNSVSLRPRPAKRTGGPCSLNQASSSDLSMPRRVEASLTPQEGHFITQLLQQPAECVQQTKESEPGKSKDAKKQASTQVCKQTKPETQTPSANRAWNDRRALPKH